MLRQKETNCSINIYIIKRSVFVERTRRETKRKKKQSNENSFVYLKWTFLDPNAHRVQSFIFHRFFFFTLSTSHTWKWDDDAASCMHGDSFKTRLRSGQIDRECTRTIRRSINNSPVRAPRWIETFYFAFSILSCARSRNEIIKTKKLVLRVDSIAIHGRTKRFFSLLPQITF